MRYASISPRQSRRQRRQRSGGAGAAGFGGGGSRPQARAAAAASEAVGLRRIGREQAPHERGRFAVRRVGRNRVRAVENLQRRVGGKRVRAEAQRVQDAAQRPTIGLWANLVLSVQVDHLGRAVHGRRIFGDALLLLQSLFARALRGQHVARRRAEIAEHVFAARREKHVFELEVAASSAAAARAAAPPPRRRPRRSRGRGLGERRPFSYSSPRLRYSKRRGCSREAEQHPVLGGGGRHAFGACRRTRRCPTAQLLEEPIPISATLRSRRPAPIQAYWSTGGVDAGVDKGVAAGEERGGLAGFAAEGDGLRLERGLSRAEGGLVEPGHRARCARGDCGGAHRRRRDFGRARRGAARWNSPRPRIAMPTRGPSESLVRLLAGGAPGGGGGRDDDRRGRDDDRRGGGGGATPRSRRRRTATAAAAAALQRLALAVAALAPPRPPRRLRPPRPRPPRPPRRLRPPRRPPRGDRRDGRGDSERAPLRPAEDDPLPGDWKAHTDPASGKTYYYSTAENRTTWTRPQPPPRADAGGAAPPASRMPQAALSISDPGTCDGILHR